MHPPVLIDLFQPCLYLILQFQLLFLCKRIKLKHNMIVYNSRIFSNELDGIHMYLGPLAVGIKKNFYFWFQQRSLKFSMPNSAHCV